MMAVLTCLFFLRIATLPSLCYHIEGGRLAAGRNEMNRLKILMERYQSLGIREQLDYDRFYLYSIITHSTAIEGSTVTEIENQLLFDEGIGTDKPLVEQLMNLDLKEAYGRAFKAADDHQEITREFLCMLSSVVMKNTGSVYNTIAGTFSSADGDLRMINVSAGRGGKSYMAWQKVAQRLDEFCEWINTQRETLLKSSLEEIYDLSFEAHYRLVYIHPWADGNGRMARLVMNMIQREAGVVPSIVKKEARAEYIKSLADAQDRKDSAIFRSFMMEHHVNNLEEQIREYEASQANETIFDHDETLNETLNESEKALITAIQNNQNLTVDSLVNKTGFSRAKVNRIISSLKEKGLLKRIGSKKTGYWEITG